MRILAGTHTPQAAPQNGAAPPPPAKPARFSLVRGQASTVALKYPAGKRVSSRFGPDQMMYTLADGRVGYFPLAIAAEIDSLHLAAGEPFSICDYGQGEWAIERAHPNAAKNGGSAAPPEAPRPAAGKINGQGEDSAAILERCFLRAVNVALAAAEYARGKGLQIAPRFEDIRAMAATLHINETGGRR